MTCKRTKFKHYVDELQKKKNRSESKLRAEVGHPFRILKRIFGFDKVRYWGSKKPSPTVHQLRAGEPVPQPQTSAGPRAPVRLKSVKQPVGPLDQTTGGQSVAINGSSHPDVQCLPYRASSRTVRSMRRRWCRPQRSWASR